ncbi:Protein of unknown function [Arboricoccus pini]|uniref:DUF3553 domain-containing protein n=1 Tax=Arboricoccus pini TaxID=1963835 RepID=A0A212RTS2_9PROT|nr:DUF3553 domain-containing protein [Arboricoccus pini]SNB76092.1 Protein of unknown function [Arboricoccus pini]
MSLSPLAPADLTPGAFVRHPERPEWGLGQVQSAVGSRVTVNFEHAGKLLLDVRHIRLVAGDPARPKP